MGGVAEGDGYAGDLSGKSEEFREIVKLFATIWVKANRNVKTKSWERFREEYDSTEKGFDSVRVVEAAKEILDQLHRANIIGISGIARNLSDKIEIELARRWF